MSLLAACASDDARQRLRANTEDLIARGNIPRHVAIIMDGNGRWARARGLPRAAGHKAGIDAVLAEIERLEAVEGEAA